MSDKRFNTAAATYYAARDAARAGRKQGREIEKPTSFAALARAYYEDKAAQDAAKE